MVLLCPQVLSLLSYLIKAPLVPQGTPIVNSLFAQRCVLKQKVAQNQSHMSVMY